MQPRPIPQAPDCTLEASQDRFTKTRCDHARELASDYAELIDDLQRRHGEARIADMARHLGTSHVTVVGKLERLARDGIVRRRPYRGVFLTDVGMRLAQEARERHAAVRELLVALGTPASVADRDAEGMAHHVSPETLAAFRAFLYRRSRDGGEQS
jgi:DtxR family manganese transport transcriptional regulator